MFNSPQKLLLPDESHRTSGITLQVNWNNAVSGSRFIKMKLGNKEVVVRRDQLEAILFMIGDEESQRNFVMRGATLKKTKKVATKLFLTATNHIKKGDTIVVNYYKEVPQSDEEVWRPKSKTLVI